VRSAEEEIEKALLEYFAQSESAARGYQSLTTVLELIDRPKEWQSSFFDRVQGRVDKRRLRVILDEMVEDGLLEVRASDSDFEPFYRATDQGIYEASYPMGNLVEEHDENEDGSVVRDSIDWTGSRLIHVDNEVLLKIKLTSKKLQAAAHRVNYKSEADRSDVTGLADALAALCEMAEPELTIIEAITAHPKFKMYAALMVFVATIRGALGI
jgi:hypothetical protein